MFIFLLLGKPGRGIILAPFKPIRFGKLKRMHLLIQAQNNWRKNERIVFPWETISQIIRRYGGFIADRSGNHTPNRRGYILEHL